MSKAWGPCTWYLFHTLAEKVKEETFPTLKNGLITIIKRICSNLPCPSCAEHARQKMESLNVNNIRSKHDLKLMLLSFHNDVNRRLNRPEFTEQQLNEKYKLLEESVLLKKKKTPDYSIGVSAFGKQCSARWKLGRSAPQYTFSTIPKRHHSDVQFYTPESEIDNRKERYPHIPTR